jgi:hypothetical protein
MIFSGMAGVGMQLVRTVSERMLRERSQGEVSNLKKRNQPNS